jgi:protein TonB
VTDRWKTKTVKRRQASNEVGGGYMTVAIPILLASFLAAGPVPATTQASEDRVYKKGDDVRLPVLVKEIKPEYTADAIRERLQGTILLECVVRKDGTVGTVRVKQGVAQSLDQAAVDAVKQWEFKPGTKDDKAVAVQLDIEITFTLK